MSDPLTYANSDEYVLVNPNDPKVGHLIYDAPMVDADTKQFIRDSVTGKIKVYRMVIWGTKGLTQAQVEALITEKNATMVTKVTNIENRLNTVLDSDDTDLDQLSELVTEIKANRSNIALLVSNKATKEELQSAVNTINANIATVANKSNAISVSNTPSQSLENGSGEIVPNTAKLNTVDLSEIRNNYLTDLRSAFINVVLDKVYPVGSIYISVNNTSPSTLFGGTWERIQEKFLLSAGNTHTAGTTGGEFTHTLTTAEMPVHNHDATTANGGNHNHSASTGGAGAHNHTVWDAYSTDVSHTWAGGSSGATINANSSGTTRTTSTNSNHSHTVTVNNGGTHNHSTTISNTGSGNAHNITPPYLAVYMWKRTA